MMRWKGTALVLAVLGTATAARAQSADTVRRFSLFGGAAQSDGGDSRKVFPELALGGSADFRVNTFPLALRTTLAFSQAAPTFHYSAMRYGTFSLDAVTRAGRGPFGLHPYLLGGLGVGTLAPIRVFVADYMLVDNQVVLSPSSREINWPRFNWAYIEGGGGLELGKFFVEAKIQQPAAMNGPTRKPVSFGIRF